MFLAFHAAPEENAALSTMIVGDYFSIILGGASPGRFVAKTETGIALRGPRCWPVQGARTFADCILLRLKATNVSQKPRVH